LYKIPLTPPDFMVLGDYMSRNKPRDHLVGWGPFHWPKVNYHLSGKGDQGHLRAVHEIPAAHTSGCNDFLRPSIRTGQSQQGVPRAEEISKLKHKVLWVLWTPLHSSQLWTSMELHVVSVSSKPWKLCRNAPQLLSLLPLWLGQFRLRF
jgi:hypothetical protein